MKSNLEDSKERERREFMISSMIGSFIKEDIKGERIEEPRAEDEREEEVKGFNLSIKDN